MGLALAIGLSLTQRRGGGIGEGPPPLEPYTDDDYAAAYMIFF